MNDQHDKQPESLPADLQAEADALARELDSGTDASQVANTSPDTPQVDTGEMLSGLLMITFNSLLAPRRGDHWAMGKAECDALGQAYGAVIDKYFPDLTAGPELTAIIITVGIIGPRLAQDMAAKEPEKKPAKEPKKAQEKEPDK